MVSYIIVSGILEKIPIYQENMKPMQCRQAITRMILPPLSCFGATFAMICICQLCFIWLWRGESM